MALSPEDLASRIKSLKRAPVPKVPIAANASRGGLGAVAGSSIQFPVQVKKTRKKESLIEADNHAGHQNGKGGNSDDLQAAFAKRRAQFEQNNSASKPATLPKPRRLSKGEKENEGSPGKLRSGSFPVSSSFRDTNGNFISLSVQPVLKPLPTLQSIGSPPRKPAKPAFLKAALDKYRNNNVMIAPRVKSMASEVEVNGVEEDAGEDFYDDLATFGYQDEVVHPGANASHTIPEEEPIQEEMYDDVDQLADQVKAELAMDGNTNQQNGEPITEDFYDDLDTLRPPPNPQPGSGGLTSGGGGDDEFGDELYQPVDSLVGAGDVEDIGGEDEYELLPNEQEPMQQQQIHPPPPRQSQKSPEEDKKKDKKDKDKEKKESKELQKKRERDELKRKKEEERRDKEEKKRGEEEKKKREKVDRELKKSHKLKGNEPTVAVGVAKEDFKGTGKQELPCLKGTALSVIRKEGCPTGKWLVTTPQGHIGYVPSELVQLQNSPDSIPSVTLDEDLYECVDTFQSNESPPPPPPSPSQKEGIEEELYDDTMDCDEDFYDDIPGAN